MKKSNQIIGLPIISIVNGEKVGSVKSLVVNPDKGSLDFLIIEKEESQVSIKAIPFQKIVGIGEYAVTIETDSEIIDLTAIPIVNQLVNKKININGSKVMTRKGMLIGEVQEYFVDEENGQILGIIIQVDHHEKTLSVDSIITYGRDLIIVKENATEYFLDTPEQLISHKKELDNEDEYSNNDLTEQVQDEKIQSDRLEAEELESQQLNKVQEFQQKQFEILNGKVVKKDILDDRGNILFAKGTVLGKKEIEIVQQQNPSVLVELSMNVDVQ